MIVGPRIGAARLGLLAGSLVLLALPMSFGLESCAHVSSPPGGPADSLPPVLIAVVPDSFSVMPDFDDYVRFQFDEVISEQGIRNSAIVFPFEPRPRIRKGKSELRVRPQAGWTPDQIYHIRVEPAISDLFRNTIRDPISYVFSTGIPLTRNRVQGAVYDRISGRPLAQGRVDMVQLPDTLRYNALADSVGSFSLGSIPEGEYLAIGYEDVNNSRYADEFDRSDTVRVRLGDGDTLSLEFNVFHHDTVGPVLAAAEAVDSLTVRLEFDGYLDPEAPLDPADVAVFSLADSLPVVVDTVLHGWQHTAYRDSLRLARIEIADSLAEVRALAASLAAARARVDSLTQVGAPPEALAAARARADSLAAADTLPAAQALEAQERAGAAGLPGEPPERPQAGQGGEEEPEETQRLPSRELYVVAVHPLAVGPHGVRIANVRNLSGLIGGGEASFEPPEPQQEEPPEPRQEERPEPRQEERPEPRQEETPWSPQEEPPGPRSVRSSPR